MTSRVCLMPACLFLRSYKFVRNPSLSGGGTASKGGFLAHSPLGFETKLPRLIFPLPDHLSVPLAQPEASPAIWLRCQVRRQGFSPAQAHLLPPAWRWFSVALQTLLFEILY